MELQTKICTKCKIEKPLNEFAKRKDSKDGLRGNCQVCLKSYQSKYRDIHIDEKEEYNRVYRKKNIEHIRQKENEYNIKNRDKRLKYQKEYRIENKDKLLADKKDYYDNNKNKLKIKSKIYRKTDKGKISQHNSSCKKRLAKKIGDVTNNQLLELKIKSTHCYWCNLKLINDYHIDHYYPLSKGGKHTISNLVISCPKCNMTKHAKDPIEFANSIGKLL